MRELNQFNKTVLGKFASRQAYAQIKGHYIPIINNSISDESVMELEKRKYYIQNYEFTMLGFLIDEDEFEVSPAVSRVLQVFEFEQGNTKKQRKILPENKKTSTDAIFVVGNNTINQIFDYTTDVSIGQTTNINTFDVFINNYFYGSDISEIQINTNDVLKLVVTKTDNTLESRIQLINLVI